VGPRVGLDPLEKRKVAYHYRGSKDDLSNIQPQSNDNYDDNDDDGGGGGNNNNNNKVYGSRKKELLYSSYPSRT
jgi:hypothetical protein